MHTNTIREPSELIGWLADQAPSHRACIECGAGRAEVSAFLARFFNRVVATDRAPPPDRDRLAQMGGFDYQTCPAEDLSRICGPVDLVVSMQALHHFDKSAHVEAAYCVLGQRGVFAALCWGDIQLPPGISRAYAPVFEAVHPFWEPERSWVSSGYSDLGFPGSALCLPAACLTRRMSLDALDATIAGWSATQAALCAGVDLPDANLTRAQRKRTGEFRVQWPLIGQVFRRN